MPRALNVDILKSSHNGKVTDCTNGGFSSTRDCAFLANPEGPLETTSGEDYLVIKDGPYNTIRAVPKSLVDAEVWVTFGGNFIYSCDERFCRLNNGAPIKIFDRVE